MDFKSDNSLRNTTHAALASVWEQLTHASMHPRGYMQLCDYDMESRSVILANTACYDIANPTGFEIIM